MKLIVRGGREDGPQWSRPIDGRMTNRSANTRSSYNPQQWGRPIDGRMSR